MRCVYCHGKGTIQATSGPQPCAECGGSGLLHCCEGMQARPEDGKEGCSQESPRKIDNGEGFAE